MATPYNRAITLGAHNAYATTFNGYTYADQCKSIIQQIELGAHWLSIDVWRTDGRIVLQHNTAAINALIRPTCSGPLLLEDFLELIGSLIRSDPELILTFDLEDHVPNPHRGQLTDIIERTIGEYVLRSDGSQTRTNWPTLDEMRKSNKRIVLFDQVDVGDLFHSFWSDLWMTHYGTVDPVKAVETSAIGSPNDWPIRVVNFFPTVSIRLDWAHINTERLDQTLQEFKRRYPNVQPNMVALNMIGRGTPRQVITQHFPNAVWY